MSINKLGRLAKRLEKTMACNCDLDNWQPENSTGHSRICRIHGAALNLARKFELREINSAKRRPR